MSKPQPTRRRWAAMTADIREHALVGMTAPPPKPADPARHSQAPFVAWQDLIFSAAFEPHDVRVNGLVVSLDRGQFLAGRKYWALRWNWGEQAVRGFFTRLAHAEMIAFCNQGSNQGVIVAKLCNYEAFQGASSSRQPRVQPPSNQAATSEQPHNTRDTRDTVGRGAPAKPSAGVDRNILDSALADFNRAAETVGFSRCTTLTETRAKALGKRLADLGAGDAAKGAVHFREALTAIPHWPFLAGKAKARAGDKPFRLDLERLLSTGSGMGDVLAKLYDLHDEHGAANTTAKTASNRNAMADAWREAQAEELATQRARFNGAADDGGTHGGLH